MSAREQFVWAVAIQTQDGQTAVEKVRAYWDPNHELTDESVRGAAVDQVKRATGMRAVATRVELVTS